MLFKDSVIEAAAKLAVNAYIPEEWTSTWVIGGSYLNQLHQALAALDQAETAERRETE